MTLEEILIHMFYALETDDLETYVYLRAKAICMIHEKNNQEYSSLTLVES